MLVPVRNLKNGPTVFTTSDWKDVYKWEAKGDSSGEDIQEIPQEVIDTGAFRRAVQRGCFEVVSTTEMDLALSKQTQSYEDRVAAENMGASEVMDRSTTNDLVMAQCVGPNSRGNGPCGVEVPVRANTRTEEPPLCNTHEGMAAEYIPVHTEQIDPATGQAIVQWTRMNMGPRETQPV